MLWRSAAEKPLPRFSDLRFVVFGGLAWDLNSSFIEIWGSDSIERWDLDSSFVRLKTRHLGRMAFVLTDIWGFGFSIDKWFFGVFIERPMSKRRLAHKTRI